MLKRIRCTVDNESYNSSAPNESVIHINQYGDGNPEHDIVAIVNSDDIIHHPGETYIIVEVMKCDDDISLIKMIKCIYSSVNSFLVHKDLLI